VFFEDADDAGEVQQGSAESIQLVAHHAVDPAGFDVGQKALKRRPVHVASGKTAARWRVFFSGGAEVGRRGSARVISSRTRASRNSVSLSAKDCSRA